MSYRSVSIIFMLLLNTVQNYANGNYKVAFESVKVRSYNAQFLNNVKNDIKPTPNKGGFLVSYSLDVLKPINMDAARVTAKTFIYRKATQKYDLIPLKFVKRICEEYKKSFIVDFTRMPEYGNITGCGMMRPGFYAIKDYDTGITLPELRIIAGKYKMNAVLQTGKTFLIDVDMYARID